MSTVAGLIMADDFKVFPITPAVATQLDLAVNLPASGSYIDVSSYERVHIWMRNGVVHGSDEPTLEPKVADSVSGTLDRIDSSLIHTVDPGDDQEYITWTIEVRKLAEDHHFMALDVGGTVSNGSFADGFMVCEGESKPVTQTTAVLPSASQYNYVG